MASKVVRVVSIGQMAKVMHYDGCGAKKPLVSLSSYPEFDKEYQQRDNKPDSRRHTSGIHLEIIRDENQLPAIKQDFA